VQSLTVVFNAHKTNYRSAANHFAISIGKMKVHPNAVVAVTKSSKRSSNRDLELLKDLKTYNVLGQG
jgi:hypothetical protein